MRHQSRETAFKIIYQVDMGKNELETALEHTMENDGLSVKEQAFCRQLAAGVQYHLAEIDAVIQRHTTGWKIDRMMSVDRNLLRLAVYEMLFSAHISPQGAINETLEMAKIFGKKESSAFINGILDKVLKNETKRDALVTAAAAEAMAAQSKAESSADTAVVVEREITPEEADIILNQNKGALE